MNSKAMKNILTFFLLLVSGAAAQYSLEWTALGGGGGESAAAEYRIEGSVGQAEAGGSMSGEGFSLDGGYWTFPDETVVLPEMTLTFESGFTVLRWLEPTFSVSLEVSDDLELWAPANPSPVGGVWAEPTPDRRFYRLVKTPAEP